MADGNFNIQDAIKQAAEVGVNMTEAQSGGGGYEAPPEGNVMLRFVKYIETGTHEEDFQGKPKKVEKVFLAFELHGKKYPKNDEGEPQILGFNMTLSLNEKAHFYKLFRRMNHDGKATHMAQLLGQGFMGTIHHNVKGEGTNAKTYANLRNEDGYTIRPPFIDKLDDEGEVTQTLVKVPDVCSPMKLFVWSIASKGMWDSIFIDGSYEPKKNDKGDIIKEGASKNYFQNLIRSALNWKDSPMQAILAAGGEPDLPDAEAPSRTEADKASGKATKKSATKAADDDPLNDM